MSGLSIRSWLTALVLLTAGPAVHAAPPADQLLPDSTKAFLSINLRLAKENWQQTQCAQSCAGMVNRLLAQALTQRLNEVSGVGERFGFGWEHVQAAAGGAAVWAILQPAPGQEAAVLLLDVSGKAEQADALLATAGKNLQQRQGRSVRQGVAGVPVTVHTPPAAGKGRPRQVCSFIKEDLLVVADSMPVVEGILARWTGDQEDSLSDLPAYHAVMKRCAAQAAQAPPIRWFIEPIGLLETLRAAAPRGSRPAADPVALLKQEGFDAIRGMGGTVHFASGDCDLLHCTAIYAPPPYRGAMRMLSFPPGSEFAPPPWAPAGLPFCATFNWHLRSAFDSVGTLCDSLLGDGGEGAFQEIIDSIRDDPDGPHVDLRRDVIGQLGSQVHVLADGMPLGPRTGVRLLIGIEATNETVLVRAIGKALQGDPKIRQRRCHGHVVWEYCADDPKLPHRALAVAQGHLLLASHAALLEEALAHPPQEFADQGDCQRVCREMDKRRADAHCCLCLFARPGDDLRASAERIRPAAFTPIMQLIGAVRTTLNRDTGKSRSSGGTPSLFDFIGPSLGPAGVFAINHDDGWSVVGFVLKRPVP